MENAVMRQKMKAFYQWRSTLTDSDLYSELAWLRDRVNALVEENEYIR
jgi:hypothetical protein